MVVQLDSVRSENTPGRDPSEDNISLLKLFATLGGPRRVGFFSGTIGTGGSFNKATWCLDVGGGLFVLRSICVDFFTDVKVMVGDFLLFVLSASLFFSR